MSENHEIKIISGDVSTKSLHFDPCDTVIVNRNDTVTWFITSEPTNVDKFKIKKKLFSRQIFSASEPPPSTPTNRGHGRVRDDAKDGWVYNYSIWWKPKASNDWIKQDPKIAVNTSLMDEKQNLLLWAAAGLTAVGLTALFFIYTKRKKSKFVHNPIRMKTETSLANN